uniref:Uncharacterized protein n=2 Tax=Kalanchoe fedtschenkoi TaxID=63787 RepID=A0A7N1A6V1_KALFE
MIGLLVRIFSRPLRQCSCRLRYSDRPKCGCGNMDSSNLNLLQKKSASFRLCNVSGHTTELLEIGVQNPTLQLIVIPGNPGVVTFYKEFVESLYHLFEGRASVTAVGHISHTKKVGHSIGAYISLEVFRRVSELVAYCIGLYPFLALDMQSSKQSMIGKLSASSILCTALSSLAGILGLLPNWVSKYLVKNSVGISWSVTAAEAACTHLLQYHTLRNVLFMAMTEFRKRNLTGQL